MAQTLRIFLACAFSLTRPQVVQHSTILDSVFYFFGGTTYDVITFIICIVQKPEYLKRKKIFHKEKRHSFYSGFRSHKIQAVLGRQKGDHGLRRSIRRPLKLGPSLLQCFGKKESRLVRLSHIQRCRSFSERVCPRIILLESQPGKQSSGSKRFCEITTEPIAV